MGNNISQDFDEQLLVFKFDQKFVTASIPRDPVVGYIKSHISENIEGASAIRPRKVPAVSSIVI